MKYALLSTPIALRALGTGSCAAKTDLQNEEYHIIPENLLALPVVSKTSPEFDGYVIINTQGISLLIPQIAKQAFRVDFTSDAIRYRAGQQIHRRELIARACAIRGVDVPITIVDATAGFGRDAFILANAGFTLRLIERNPIVAALLADGIARIPDPGLQKRMQLIQDDSMHYLQTLMQQKDKPEVIYLDPMFDIARHAKVKKDLQLLQYLSDTAPKDQDQLLTVALQTGVKRVVVKRACNAAPLNNQPPHFSLPGKQTRFDIYTQTT